VSGLSDAPDESLDRLDDETFLAAFEAGTLPPAGFKHPEHVRAAWLMLRRYGPAEALARYPAALRLLAAVAGKPDLYHETVTWAWLLLIHERMARQEGTSWEAFRGANPDLFASGGPLLRRYYREETLRSQLARRVFVLPDLLVPTTP
jgi:hypothetical protein